MDAYGENKTSDDYKNMQYWAYKAGKNDYSWKHGGSWSAFWNTDQHGAANEMDNIICRITDKYRDHCNKGS